MTSTFPKYEIVMSISDLAYNPRPFSILETIETWDGPRTYIRQRGFESYSAAEAAIRAKGGRTNYAKS